MALSELFGGFRQTNHPPETRAKPVCPSSEIISICATLADFQINSNRFCGHEVTHEDSIGPLSGFRGDIFWPVSTCSNVHGKLGKMIEFTKEHIEVQNESQIDKILTDTTKSVGERIKTADENMEKVKRKREQEQLLARWRNTVWELTCSNKDVEKPEDLSEDEIIGKVEAFLKALGNITGPSFEKSLSLSRTTKGAENCPQTPRYGQNGEYS